MRIITRKIYRAYPELDAYTDEQCVQYMANVKQRKLRFSMQIILIPTLLGLFHLLGIPILLRIIGRYLYDFWNALSTLDDTLFLLCWGVLIFIWLGGSAFWPLFLRDKLLSKSVRRVLNSQLEKTRCRKCSYSLIGQTPCDDTLSCPECGTVTTMQRLGITQEDLIPPSES